MLEHSIFALPFTLSATLLATGPNLYPSLPQLLWIILAMTGGRTYAMGLNRIADKHIDALNPRTAKREIPAGKVKPVEAWSITLLALGLLCIAVMQLPPLCLQLLPLAIAILTAYSFVKRFSWLCHIVLGLALGSGAIAGWVAITNTLPFIAVLWGLAVLCWVSGFDILYACQDEAFDKEHGLHSVPSRFGLQKAFLISRVLHALTIGMMISVGILLNWVGLYYWLACTLMTLLLAYEHSIISPEDFTRMDHAFFTTNGLVSVGVMLFILLDRVL